MDGRTISVEEQLHWLTNSIIDYAYFTLHADGTVASWNRGAQRVLGYSAAQALGSVYSRFWTGGSQAHTDAEHELAQAAERGQFEVAGRLLRSDGGEIEVYRLLTALRDERRQLLGFAVLLRDTTDQQRTRQMFYDQQRRLQSIVDTAVDAVVIIDEHGIVESFNHAGERMFGYRANEVVGRNVNMLMPSPFAEEHTGHLQRYLRTGQAKIIGIGREVQARRKDGTLFPADLAVSEFYDGKPLFTGILRDISDRKRLETEVAQIAEAEQRRIGQELHDDAQQQIAGLTMIARHTADALVPYIEREPGLGDIRRKVERLVQGLHDIHQSLQLLARGLVPLQVDAHGLQALLAQLADHINEQPGVFCEFTTDVQHELGNGVVATNLYRITQEAVTNALKHSAATNIAIRLNARQQTATLEIEDNGTGIDERNSTTGRGLQIMNYRASLIGGLLTVRRGRDGGTAVTCHLPRIPEPPASTTSSLHAE